MKIVGFILAILVILMPGQPLFAGISCMDKAAKPASCCSKKMKRCPLAEKTNNKKSSKKADKKSCPFEVCNCCYYSKINRPVFEVPCIMLQGLKVRLTNESIISNFVSDCWHPPEFV